MSLALIITGRNANSWKESILAIAPDIRIEIYPDIKNPEKVECALLWDHPGGVLKSFPNLKWVSSLGAGVEHILSDADLKDEVAITRIVDDHLKSEMACTAIMAISAYRNNLYCYLEDQKRKAWNPVKSKPEISIGIMGLGSLGTYLAECLLQLNFEVFGWAGRQKKIKGVKTYAAKELDTFLKRVNMLVCLLPETKETRGLLNKDFFSKIKPGTYLINLGRGSLIVENDLLGAIKAGQLSEAFLDVFAKEPLPEDHPFWGEERIIITPHTAALTNIKSAAVILAENYFRLKSGTALLFAVDRKKGY